MGAQVILKDVVIGKKKRSSLESEPSCKENLDSMATRLKKKKHIASITTAKEAPVLENIAEEGDRAGGQERILAIPERIIPAGMIDLDASPEKAVQGVPLHINSKDRITLNFPLEASVTSGFKRIRAECSRLYFKLIFRHTFQGIPVTKGNSASS